MKKKKRVSSFSIKNIFYDEIDLKDFLFLCEYMITIHSACEHKVSTNSA